MSLIILNRAKLHGIEGEYQRPLDDVSESARAQFMGNFSCSWILDKHPRWNPMRADQRFKAVLKRYNDKTARQHGLQLEMRAKGEVPVRGNAAVMRSVDARPP